MSAPALESVAQRLYTDMQPLAYDDANQGYALAQMLAAYAEMIQVVADYAEDQFDAQGRLMPGWSQIMDINRAPSAGLGWLAQFVGVRLRLGLDDASQRARIRSTDGWNRGTPAAMVAAAQQYLIGAKTVIMRERDAAACPSVPAYGLTVITYAAQTPNPAAVLSALNEQKPAGIILRYVTLTGEDYQSLLNNHPLYSNVYADFATYQGVVTATPGT